MPFSNHKGSSLTLFLLLKSKKKSTKKASSHSLICSLQRVSRKHDGTGFCSRSSERFWKLLPEVGQRKVLHWTSLGQPLPEVLPASSTAAASPNSSTLPSYGPESCRLQGSSLIQSDLANQKKRISTKMCNVITEFWIFCISYSCLKIVFHLIHLLETLHFPKKKHTSWKACPVTNRVSSTTHMPTDQEQNKRMSAKQDSSFLIPNFPIATSDFVPMFFSLRSRNNQEQHAPRWHESHLAWQEIVVRLRD